MNKEEQIGTLVGLDLILSPEHYKEINDLKEENKQLKNILTELEEYILNHYIVGHTIQNASLDDIVKKLKELKEKYKC